MDNIENQNLEESTQEEVQQGLDEQAQTEEIKTEEQKTTEQDQTTPEQEQKPEVDTEFINQIQRRLNAAQREKAQFQGAYDKLTRKQQGELDGLKEEIASLKNAITQAREQPVQQPPPNFLDNPDAYAQYLQENLTRQQKQEFDRYRQEEAQRRQQEYIEWLQQDQQRAVAEANQTAYTEYLQVKTKYNEAGTPIPPEVDNQFAQIVDQSVAPHLKAVVYELMVDRAMRNQGLTRDAIKNRVKVEQRVDKLLAQTQTADGTKPTEAVKGNSIKQIKDIRKLLDISL